MKPNIFTYLDYRLYLADMYTALKDETNRFSKRELARIAGSPSPNYLQFITERKLHISSESLHALADYFELTLKEKRYLESLVQFDHAKTHEEKDLHFQKIICSREYGSFKQLQENQYTYLSHWYMPVIRELVTSSLYPGNPQWVAEHIIPTITTAKARKGIELLETLGIIYRDKESGQYKQTDTVVTTPSEVLSISIIKYYKSIIGLGREAVERFKPDERDIRGVTIGISEKNYHKLKQQMEIFWQQIMARANEPQEIERVYHIGLQLFPLSRTLPENSD